MFRYDVIRFNNSFAFSDRVFIWGRYANWYVAQDAAGNAAVCAFDIFVRNQQCPAPAEPINGQAVCSDDPEMEFWPYR